MSKQLVQVELEKSGYDFMQHAAKLAGVWKQALADGWQVGQDVPAIVMAVVSEGPSALGDVQSFASEIAEDQIAFIKGVNIGAYDVAAVFFPKK